MTLIVGKKVGMTRIFTEDGVSIPVTVVEVEEHQKNVGTIGHVLVGKLELAKSISNGTSRGNKSDRKRDRKNRWC